MDSNDGKQITTSVEGGEVDIDGDDEQENEITRHSMIDIDEEEEEDEDDTNDKDDQETARQDNEDEYKYKRHTYEIMTIFMCCLFLFSTSYSKATPKDMQLELPKAHEVLQDENGIGIYPRMSVKDLSANIVEWIAWLDMPCIAIAPFAGYLVNQYDAKIALVIFMVLSFLGSSFCSLSVFYQIASWFPFGRFIFGLGVGCLRIAVNVVIKESVSPDQLSFYIQFPRTFEKTASLMDGYFTSSITKVFTWSAKWVSLPFVVGTILIAISLPFFILFYFEPVNKNEILDQEERERKRKQFEKEQGIEMVRINSKQNITNDNDGGKVKDTAKPGDINNKNDDDNQKYDNPLIFVYKKVLTFPLSYWLIILILFFSDAASGTYQGLLPQFVNIYYIPKEPTDFWKKAQNIRQIPAYFAIFSPIFGYIVDWTGNKRYLLLIFSCIGLALHHAINVSFGMTRLYFPEYDLSAYSWILYLNLLFQGFVNAFIGATLIPGIAFVTKRSALSVAYGILSSASAVANVLLTKVISRLVEKQTAAIQLFETTRDLPIQPNEPNPVTKYTLTMAIIFATCSILCMLLSFIFVCFYRDNICPQEIIPSARDDGIKIIQDMEKKDDIKTIRNYSTNRKQSKRSLPKFFSPSKSKSRSRRRTSSFHYVSRFR